MKSPKLRSVVGEPQPSAGVARRASGRGPNPTRRLRLSAERQDGRMRIVSLLPSATEIVYALGLGDDLAGVTFECDEPPSARTDKTVVVGGRDTRDLTPAQIDDYVTS